MRQFFRDLHPIRIALLSAVLLSIVFQPAPGTAVTYEGLAVFPTLLLPVLMPILLMLLWLDSIIAKIWSSQEECDKREHYRLLVKLNLVLSVIFFASWYPYFESLVS